MENLPNEIIVNILKYLNTFDLIQFCKAYRTADYLLQERKLIHRVNLSKEFQIKDINLPKFISTKLNPNLIYVLNINSLYWIPSTDLLRLLSKLENLKELYAVDTKLGLSHNITEYHKLVKLGLTLTENELDSKALINLKSLFIKIALSRNTFNFQDVFNDKMNLEELWISNEDRILNYEIIPCILKNLKKLVIRTRSFSPFYDLSPFGLHMIFQCSRNDSEIQFIYESVPKITRSISMFEPLEDELEAAWDVLHRHNKDLSCGPKAGKELFLGQKINNIYFEDLNFGHSIILCQSKYIDAATKILLSKNASQLKRLHFRSCLFQRKGQSGHNVLTESHIGFKKPRCVIEEKIDDDPFENISKNLTKLRELEIFFCLGCFTKEVLSSYNLISAFEHLEQLTLEIPLLLDGSFIKSVLMDCKKLKSLKVSVTSQNEKFVSRLCENLKYANSLKDFRLKHAQLHIEKLLAGLDGIPGRKLQRIFIKCDHLRYTNSNIQIFDVFLKNNPQLVFLFLIVQKHTVKQNSDIQKIFNEHKKGIPSRVFYIKKDYTFTGFFPIPTAHRDMIYKHTNVSVINFDEF